MTQGRSENTSMDLPIISTASDELTQEVKEALEGVGSNIQVVYVLKTKKGRKIEVVKRNRA